MTFEEAMLLTRTVSSHTAFEDEECKAYFDILMTLEPDSLIVEVGLEHGRSSSIALQVAKERNLRYIGIDLWLTDSMVALTHKLSPPAPNQFQIMRGYSTSCDVTDITAIMIDGDHCYEGVMDDCEHFLPHVVKGGYFMAHDVCRDSLPDVTRAISDYMRVNESEWGGHGIVGTLGIWRRI